MKLFKTVNAAIQSKLTFNTSTQELIKVHADNATLKVHVYSLEHLKALAKSKKNKSPCAFSLFSKSPSPLAATVNIKPIQPSKLLTKISQLVSRKNSNHPLQEFIRSLSTQAKKKLTSPTPIDDIQPKLSPNPSFSAEIIKVVEENEEFKTIFLKRPQGWKFLPGQYLEIRSDDVSESKPLILAIASGVDDDYIMITAKPNSDPTHPNFCLNKAVGDHLNIKGPLGSHFPMELISHNTPVFVLGGGSGLTALKSIMESLPKNADTKMIYSSKTLKELTYRKQIEKWKSQGHTISLTQESAAGYAEGRITEHLKNEQFKTGSLFFICGPKELVLQTTKELVKLGVPRESIYGSLPSTKNGGPVYRADHPKMSFIEKPSI